MNSIPHLNFLTPERAAPTFLAGGGSCGALIAERDWSWSTMGSPDGWPVSLRVIASALLRSPMPMALLWGNEAILLYNDGYAALAGRRHPALLGRPVHEAWPELVKFHENVLSVVLAGGTLSYEDVELTLERHGEPEQAFFRIEYSPVLGDDDRPAGVLVAVVETTGAVLDARALREAGAQARIDAERVQLALDAGAILGTWNWDPVADTFTADERFASSFGLEPAACRKGLPSAAMVGSVVAGDLPAMQEAVAQVLARGGPYRHECRVRLADGSVRWIEVSGRVDLASDGTPLRFPGVFLDITARKAAEVALKAAEARASEAAAELKAILDTAPVPILIARDPAALRIEANRAGREIMRLPDENANLSKSAADAASQVGHYHVVHPEGVEFTPEDLPLQRAARGETVEISDERVVFADGEERWFQGQAVPLLDADGQPRGAVGAYIDITARKKAEADLQRSEARFRGVFSAGVIGFAIFELDTGQALEINDRFLEMTGHTRADFEEGRWNYREFTPPEYLPLDEAAIAQVRETGRWGTFEKEYVRRDGTRIPVRLSGAALPGQPGLIVVVAEDMSGRKAAQLALQESEERFRNMADHSPAIVWVTSPDGGFTYLNARWFEITGQTESDVLNHGWHRAIHPEDLAVCEPIFADAQERKVPFKVEFRLRAVTGDWLWVLDTAAPRWDRDGSFRGFVGSMIDITDRKEAEIRLSQSEAFASSILVSAADCIKVVDLEGRLEYMNPPGRCLVEIDDISSVLGKSWSSLWPAEALAKVEAALAAARAGRVERFTAFCPTAKGTPKWWDVTVSPITGEDGRCIRLLSTSRDITASKRAQDELEQARERAEYAALHDGLTGLPNRSCFRAHLEERLRQAGSIGRTALLFLDLDEFKSVNDALGHPAGDQLLRDAAARLQSCLRASDLIARFGGDEFAILQGDVSRDDDIESLSERIIGCLSEPYLIEGREVVVGVSIGIAVPQSRPANPDDLLRKADIALYQAKAAGRGVFRFFEPDMEEAAKKNQLLRTDLREALARGEFLLHYQPVVEFGSLRVTAFEALLRWRHPQRGLLSPGEFISLAEETGAIEEIGAWVLREASTRAAAWPEDISVSVNLSSRQFTGGGLLGVVSDALRTSKLAPERLQLEITESLILQDGEAVRDALTALRAAGVRISIDDFGTGYSSLGYLRRFAVDNLKIDKSFVRDLGGNPRASAILDAVLSLARQLDVSVTAEGIETEKQSERLSAMGCRFGQGYLFSRPLPVEKLDWLIKRSRATELVADSQD